MKWLGSVGVAVSLALQPALAEALSGNHPLTPEARDAFVTELLTKMTVDEKIGQLRWARQPERSHPGDDQKRAGRGDF